MYRLFMVEYIILNIIFASEETGSRTILTFITKGQAKNSAASLQPHTSNTGRTLCQVSRGIQK